MIGERSDCQLKISLIKPTAIRLLLNQFKSMAAKFEEENLLDKALRTYQQSQQQLKTISYSIQQQNEQLQEKLQDLQDDETKLINQRHRLREQIQQITIEQQILKEKQSIYQQQINEIHQRFIKSK